MKLLILTQYYPPEVGAPQNRLSALAEYFSSQGHEVSVLTAMPNYPKMEIHELYKGEWFCKEERNGVSVFRSRIYVTKSKSIVPRLLNYFSFVWSSFFAGIFRIKKHDIVLCESPPLFLGITALWIKWLRGSKLIFNVSDLWPESAEKLGLVSNKMFLGMAYWLEKYIYKRNWIISGQTQGIVKNIEARFPEKSVYWLRNGIDVEKFKVDIDPEYNFRSKLGIADSSFVLMYAGIIGHAQGLEVILKAAETLKDQKDIVFVLQGSGPEKVSLEQMKEEKELNNVYFEEVKSKREMPSIINSVDATIIPLKKLDIFKGAIPSKIFDSLALKKPLLLGVEGEAEELFIMDGNAGLKFEPENEKELAECILELYNDRGKCAELGNSGYAYVCQNFSRRKICEDFNSYIESKNNAG